MRTWYGRGVAIMAFGACLIAASASAKAQQALVIKPLAEKKVSDLPAGALYWRIENFATRSRPMRPLAPRHW